MAVNDPLVVKVARDYRAALLANELEQMEIMANRWIQVVDALEPRMALLQQQIGELVAAGETVTESQLLRLSRWQELLIQAEIEIAQYNQDTNDLITAQQRYYAQVGIDAAVEEITAYYYDSNVVPAAFNILPVDAVQVMAGLAGDGAPLMNLLEQAYDDFAGAVSAKLIEAVALGLNPRETARRIRDAANAPLDRALLIARTEQLRAFREAGRRAYETSGVVEGYMRISARDLRVCMACLLLDNGYVYPLSQPFEEHPAGRCAQVPAVIGLPKVTWQYGEDWFMTLDKTDQIEMMGPGRYNAWQAGQFKLKDIVGIRQNETWGNSPYERPLYSLVPGGEG